MLPAWLLSWQRLLMWHDVGPGHRLAQLLVAHGVPVLVLPLEEAAAHPALLQLVMPQQQQQHLWWQQQLVVLVAAAAVAAPHLHHCAEVLRQSDRALRSVCYIDS